MPCADHAALRGPCASRKTTLLQAANAVTRSLDAVNVAHVLQLRTLFQLQRHVRTKDGEDLLDVLPYGPDALLAADRVDVEWVVGYMDRLQLTKAKAAFLELVGSPAPA